MRNLLVGVEEVVVGVLALSAGIFLAFLLPLFIGQTPGSAFEKTLGGLMLAGLVCFLFGAGGLGIASAAGATAAVTWSLRLACAGMGMMVLVRLTRVIWRRAAASRT